MKKHIRTGSVTAFFFIFMLALYFIPVTAFAENLTDGMTNGSTSETSDNYFLSDAEDDVQTLSEAEDDIQALSDTEDDLQNSPSQESKTYTVNVTYRLCRKTSEDSGASHYNRNDVYDTQTKSFTVTGNTFDLPLESDWGIVQMNFPTGISYASGTSNAVYNSDGSVTLKISESYSSDTISLYVSVGKAWTSRIVQRSATFGAGDTEWQYTIPSITAAVPADQDISNSKNYQGTSSTALDGITGVHPNAPAGYHYCNYYYAYYYEGGTPTQANLADFGLSIDSSGTITGTMKKLNGNQYLYIYYFYVADKYSVIYDSNNGSDDTYDGGTYYWGTSYSVAANDTTNFTRDGYTFTGWNTKADGSGTSYATGDSFTIPQENTTLYAQWRLNLTLDANGYTGIYDGQAHQVTATANQNAAITYSIDGGITWTETVPEEVNVSDTSVLVKAATQYEEVISDPVSLTITPVTLTVTADSYERNVGEENPVFTGTITGFINGESEAVLSGAAFYTTTATKDSPVGTYEITAAAGTLESVNYIFTFVPGTLTVTEAAVTPEPSNAPDSDDGSDDTNASSSGDTAANSTSSKTATTSAQTKDSSHVTLWSVLLFASILGSTAASILRRRKIMR